MDTFSRMHSFCNVGGLPHSLGAKLTAAGSVMCIWTYTFFRYVCSLILTFFIVFRKHNMLNMFIHYIWDFLLPEDKGSRFLLNIGTKLPGRCSRSIYHSVIVRMCREKLRWKCSPTYQQYLWIKNVKITTNFIVNCIIKGMVLNISLSCLNTDFIFI